MTSYLYMLMNIVTLSFIGVVILGAFLRPRFDKTSEGDLLLWYTNPFKKGLRSYFILFKKK